MKIEARNRLGPYEVLATSGAGGMGEVYKAKDTRLNRTVAIKVLPEHLAESPERRALRSRGQGDFAALGRPLGASPPRKWREASARSVPIRREEVYVWNADYGYFLFVDGRYDEALEQQGSGERGS